MWQQNRAHIWSSLIIAFTIFNDLKDCHILKTNHFSSRVDIYLAQTTLVLK